MQPRTLATILICVAALCFGFVGTLAGRMYTHHSDQHYQAEQMEREFKQFRMEVAGAINQLAQRK